MGKILIVDSSLLDRKRMRIVLEAAGHSVLEVSGPEEALTSLRSLPRGSVKLIMTELHFPDDDGTPFITTVREDLDLKEIPIIIVTPQPERTQVIDLVAIGVSTVVAKPFGGELLLRRVTETLSEQALLTQGEGSLVSWHIEDYLRRELKRTERTNSSFSLVFVQVTDSLNGQAVPLLMRALVRHMRETDVLVRLGDDQIVVLLPDTDTRGAVVVEERVWSTARNVLAEQDQGPAVTVEIHTGRASYPGEAGDGDALIAVARERAQSTPNI